MSFIGRQNMNVPSNVEIQTIVEDAQRKLQVVGPLGKLEVPLPKSIDIQHLDNQIHCIPQGSEKTTKAHWGTTAALLKNAIEGVSTGFTLQLNLVGVGYRAQVVGNQLDLKLGYSHPISLTIPEGVEASCPANAKILLCGVDKQAIALFAAKIRKFRFPEPYKGKRNLISG